MGLEFRSTKNSIPEDSFRLLQLRLAILCAQTTRKFLDGEPEPLLQDLDPNGLATPFRAWNIREGDHGLDMRVRTAMQSLRVHTSESLLCFDSA